MQNHDASLLEIFGFETSSGLSVPLHQWMMHKRSFCSEIGEPDYSSGLVSLLVMWKAEWSYIVNFRLALLVEIRAYLPIVWQWLKVDYFYLFNETNC